MKWAKEEKTPLSPLYHCVDVLIQYVCVEPGAGLHTRPAVAQALLVAKCWFSCSEVTGSSARPPPEAYLLFDPIGFLLL